jgi:hypothetical protein
MEDDMDQFDFVLAEHLHKSLEEVGALSNNEVLRWRAWFNYRAAKAELGE